MNDAPGAPVVCYGHEVPSFSNVFPKLLRLTLELLSIDQIRLTIDALSEPQRAAMLHFLGENGLASVVETLDTSKQDLVKASVAHLPDSTHQHFSTVYPNIMLRLYDTLTPEQIITFMKRLDAKDLAAQSLFIGNEGRKIVFSGLRDDSVAAVLDKTEDWVFLETGKRALANLAQYECTLIKQERVGKKLQDPETIHLKMREDPKAIYMKWIAGPFKGRELLYSTKLGTDVMRVREAGVFGIVPVTIGLDTPVARRGTNHRVTEVGFRHLLALIEKDYAVAAPRGHVQRVNHGLETVHGRKTYKMETILPRDPRLGYYCYRMMHWTDFVRGIEVKSEVYNFQDELQEAYDYKDVNDAPGFSDLDFDPHNKAYKL